MKSNLRETPKDIINLLDSDDEFPDSYVEENAAIPAYLNDNRFDNIELPWLNNCKPIKLAKAKKQCNTEVAKSPPFETIETKVENLQNSRILISSGVLSKRDLFYVKSIQEYCSESTLLWFIESLKNKSSSDRFRRSCLAGEYSYTNNENPSFNGYNDKYYLTLVIKQKYNSNINNAIY